MDQKKMDQKNGQSMKFVISSTALYKQLGAISGVIMSNPVVPILESFLFVIENGKLTITASDLQATMTTTMEINTQGNARITLPARILLDTLRNLPEQPITFSIAEDTYGVTIGSNNGSYRLAGENAADFPQLTTIQQGISVTMEGKILKRAISQTMMATSKDELRPAMSGVYINFSKENTTFVATDGHRLVRYVRSDLSAATQQSIIIPKKVLTLLNGLLTHAASVQVHFDRNYVHFSIDKVQVIARLINERYPDYENVIPTNNTNQLNISRAGLLSSLKRIAIYANRTTHQVRMTLSEKGLDLFAEDFDFSNEAHEHLESTYQGESMSIGFNAKLLIELLSSTPTDRLTMRFATPSKACLIFPQEEEVAEQLLLLIMPVILKDPAESQPHTV